MIHRILLTVALPLALAGCFGSSEPGPQRTAEQASLAVPVASRPLPAAHGICPLTLPNGETPPGEPENGANHGNGKLWTTMWPHNVLIATPSYIGPDGSVAMKWPWWWRGVRGKLTITGHRLDGRAAPLEAFIQPGYTNFQPSAIVFPTEGCWEVTGTVGDAKLTFVTLVLKASRYWPADESD